MSYVTGKYQDIRKDTGRYQYDTKVQRLFTRLFTEQTVIPPFQDTVAVLASGKESAHDAARAREESMPILLVIIALGFHFLLDWTLWVGVLIAGGGQTAIAIIGRRRMGLPLPATVSHIIAGAIGGMLVSYVPMVLVFYWTGHPSW